MRIGIDCRTILNPGISDDAGVGHYTYYLLKHLLALDQENDYVLFFDKNIGREVILEIVGNHPKTEYRFFPFHAYNHFLPQGLAQNLLRGFIAESGVDLFHSPGSPLRELGPIKTVLTVHDLGPLVHPSWYASRDGASRLKESVKSSDEFIVPSQAAKDDFSRLFNVNRKKIHVIYHGVDTSPRGTREEAGERFCFYLGSLEPRKNVIGLIHAWEKVVKDFPDLTLILAGPKKYKYQEVLREAQRLNKKSGRELVQYRGYVLGAEKWALMRNARLFIFPSLYESFGLPVLEAMSQGAPCALSSIPALLEIAQGAAEFFNPKSSVEMYRAIIKVLGDDRRANELKQKSLAQAKLFSWMRTAEETLELYRRL
jgi:glycosyltransferase involved in cell wall biosynthesis